MLISGLAALVLGGCTDCPRGGSYDCVPRYDPYYGYYNDCRYVGYQCPDTHSHDCKGGHCDGACNSDADCGTDEWCDGGRCEIGSPSTGGANGSGMTAANGGATGANGGATGARGGTASASGGATAFDAGAPPPEMDAAVADSSSSTTSSGGATSNGGASSSGGTSGGTSNGGASGATGGTSGAVGGRIRRLDFSCVRDTQCGAGECSAGLCYLACESDTECGTADRCSVETGRRLCMPDPNPPVRCDESAICRADQTCVDGACHDPCDADADCANLEDRCVQHLCFPDRRPIAECVLNVECAADLVCLDGRCVSFGGD
jgi:hypothetical protein